MVADVLMSAGVMVAWFVVPATIVAVAMRSTVVAGRVDRFLDSDSD